MARTGDTLTRQAAPRPDRPATAPSRPGLLAKFSMAHGLMVLSGLLAFFLIAAVVGDRSKVVVVAAAQGDIAAGMTVGPDLVKPARLPADSDLVGRLAPLDEVQRGKWVAGRTISAGDPIRRSDLVRAGEQMGLRSMSIPVARENAVGGALRVGDRVDVIDVVEGHSAFVVTGVQVTKVSTSSVSGGLTRGVDRDFFVVVQVSADQALALAGALADAKVDVVRSTGAEAPPTPVEPRPSGEANPVAGVTPTDTATATP
ncbi:MAG: hypothetical protein ACR2MO_00470 [Acidimicrobiales bacterium]